MGLEKTQTPSAGTTDGTQAGFATTLTDAGAVRNLATLRKRRWVLIVAFILGLFTASFCLYLQPKLWPRPTAGIQVAFSGAS